ncbi:hypothetical protein H6785_00905 [Candidatus Nomurabacteria bacterium]|nr:hypothetical protein [Candidatus Nomurabacteria bacterium]
MKMKSITCTLVAVLLLLTTVNSQAGNPAGEPTWNDPAEVFAYMETKEGFIDSDGNLTFYGISHMVVALAKDNGYLSQTASVEEVEKYMLQFVETQFMGETPTLLDENGELRLTITKEEFIATKWLLPVPIAPAENTSPALAVSSEVAADKAKAVGGAVEQLNSADRGITSIREAAEAAGDDPVARATLAGELDQLEGFIKGVDATGDASVAAAQATLLSTAGFMKLIILEQSQDLASVKAAIAGNNAKLAEQLGQLKNFQAQLQAQGEKWAELQTKVDNGFEKYDTTIAALEAAPKFSPEVRQAFKDEILLEVQSILAEAESARLAEKLAETQQRQSQVAAARQALQKLDQPQPQAEVVQTSSAESYGWIWEEVNVTYLIGGILILIACWVAWKLNRFMRRRSNVLDDVDRQSETIGSEQAMLPA